MTERSVLVRIRGDVSDLNRALMAGGRNVKDFSRELETSNDRATWLVQGLGAIVPAVAPIAVQAIPALAGLGTQAGVAAAAVGVAVSAFWGMGDALKAFNDYQADPTVANLEKVQKAMAELGPEGQDFVRQLDALGPHLHELKVAAEDGLLPGASEGLDHLINQLPQVRSLISELATAGGMNLAELGQNLDDPRWQQFFDFLHRQGAPTLAELGRTLGNVGEGMANLWMDFEPTEQGWSQGMLRMSQSFNQWAQGLDETQGFEDFLRYLHDTGPQVLDTVGSLVNMLLQVGEAAAPLGGPALAGIRLLADTISAIADSPLGPVIIGAVSATLTLSRAMALQQLLIKKTNGESKGMFATMATGYKSQLTSLREIPAAYRTVTAARKAQTAAEKEAGLVTAGYVGQLRASNIVAATGFERSAASQDRLKDSLGRVEMANYQVRTSTEQVAAAEARRTETVRKGAAGFARSAAGAAGLALAASGMADGMGLANTATLGLAGSMAGPWGAAVGAGVGLLMDFRAASKDTRDSISDLDDGLKRSDFSKTLEQYSKLKKTQADINNTSGVGDFFGDIGKSYGTSLLGLAPGASLEVDGLPEAKKSLEEWKATYLDVIQAMGQPIPANTSLSNISLIADSLAPAMRELGVTIDDVGKMSPKELDKFAADLIDVQTAADSTEGRTKALGESLSGLDDDLLSTASSAGAFAAALDAAISPGLSAEDATDKYTQAVRDLGTALKQNGHDFDGNSKAALANREASRSYMASLTDMLTKQADAGASAGMIANEIGKARDQFTAEAKAAGFSAGEIRKRLRVMGLTPKLVRTVFKAAGIEDVSQKVRHLNAQWNAIPRRVRTAIVFQGIPKSQKDLDRLAKTIHLTPGQKKIVAKLMDETPATQRKILRNLKTIDRAKTSPVVKVTDHASPMIRAIQSRIDGMHGKDVTVTTHQKTVKDNAAGGIYMGAMTIGDIRNGHRPEIAPRGVTRVFNEDETGGESYIPHANDWRRPRAKAIAQETVAILGGDVVWNAAGSFAPGYADGLSGGRSGGHTLVQASPVSVSSTVVIDAGELGTFVGRIVDERIEDADDMDGMYARTGNG